ncbi:MAG TPA: NAD(P)-binding domain-containing protein [Roseiflexaceae bacterium]|jgi:2-hydroxy-3-oxopropionate reductase|nr:NAD(P)-binding domain-containing protein [Roseiflexaceae bacterium]
MKPAIAVCGLGMLGGPMAHRLQSAGYQASGWNRSSLAPDLTGDIALWHTLEEAAQSDVCLRMLSNSDAVDAVLAAT